MDVSYKLHIICVFRVRANSGGVKKFCIFGIMETLAYIGAAGGFAGIAAMLAVVASYFKHGKDSSLRTMQASFETHLQGIQVQIQGMQNSFETHLQGIQSEMRNQNEAFRLQIQAMQASFDRQLGSWKGLWEASTQEIKELKAEIRELKAEIKALRTENTELKIEVRALSIENDKLRTEVVELKGQLKEHYKLA